MRNSGDDKLETTLGELIEAVSEVAFEYSDDTKEAYRLARVALVEILKSASFSQDLDPNFTRILTKKEYLH